MLSASRLLVAALATGLLTPASPAGADRDRQEPINAENWPRQATTLSRVPVIEARIDALLARMTLEEKIGQLIQADISAVTPEDAAEYHLGSVLNGGGSAPGGDNRTTPDRWLALADAFWEASTDQSDGGVGIPLIWGTDAVHGHSNIVGATLFPHNIGLGMANDPELMEAIGQVTAREMRVTGLDWTFAPTIAVVRNDRWGRTYESYSEDPALVTAYAPRIIEGLQGRIGDSDFLTGEHLMATAKHFAGDGGTVDGKDQGDTVISEAEFRDVQAAAYPAAIAAGVQSVMASFNSFHGRKMHGYRELLSDVLIDRMGFDGFVVGDWNGHGQIAGCTNINCPASLEAGLDLYMAPDSWKGLYANLLEQAQSGEVSMARVDEAVARVLRAKLRAGIFDAGPPSSRPLAGRWALLGAPEHRAVAREAVRKSLVLLKNENDVLPMDPGKHILLTGDGAHDIGKQSGGWTLNWQGTDNLREHFPNGMSIYEGFKAAVTPAGGRVTLSEDGRWSERPDVAVVVFGEDPYAEFQGDRPNVDYPKDDGLELLERFRADGIPTVAVFLSGRPLWVNPELNRSDAFVAAWLPGSEGGGIADVLVADEQGDPRHDFLGRLSFSWPRQADQAEVNVGDTNYDPLFPFGYGLSYASPGSVGVLSEVSGLGEGSALDATRIVAFGDPSGPWSLILRDPAGDTRINDGRGASAGGALTVSPADWKVQEDHAVFTFLESAAVILEGPPADLLRESNGDMTLALTLRVLTAGSGALRLGVGQGEGRRGLIDVGQWLTTDLEAGWQTVRIPLSCFQGAGADMESITEALVLQGSAGWSLGLATARITANPDNSGCPP